MEQKYFNYTDLLVWQKSMALVKVIYDLTAKFPDSEKFGLVSQMRRASVSIPSNIAEGKSRRTKKDYRSFIVIASASGSELETQLMLSKNLKIGENANLQVAISKLTEIKKMLSGLIASLS